MTTLLLAQIALTLFVFVMLLSSAAGMVYVERKVAALIQQRVGPYLVGPKGLLQPLADVIKLMFKEELRPRAADAFLFALAPIISASCAFAAFAVVPFGAATTLFGLLSEPIKLQVADVNVAVGAANDGELVKFRASTRRLKLTRSVTRNCLPNEASVWK